MKLTEKKRIVVKVGTSTLTHDTGKTNIARMAKLVSVLADLKTPVIRWCWCPAAP